MDNVFKQLDGNEVNYCSNQVVSRVVDDLLPQASDQTVLNLIEQFGKDLRPICCDQFSSHVLQQLLNVATYRAYNVKKNYIILFYIKYNIGIIIYNILISFKQ